MKIVHFPDPALRRRTAKVETFDDELRERVARMLELMYEGRGVGLAAPQVAWSTRLFVMNPTGDPAQSEQEVVVVNPEILRRKGREIDSEGCLSLPGITVDVERATRIVVRFQALDATEHERPLSEFDARVFQHELDHLDGILITDRMTPADKVKNAAKIEELKRAGAKQEPATPDSEPTS